MCMKKFNEVVATHPSLESILIPNVDGISMDSKVKK